MVKGSRPFGCITEDSHQRPRSPLRLELTGSPSPSVGCVWMWGGEVCGGVYMSTHLEIRSVSSEMSSSVTIEIVSLTELEPHS